MPRVVAIREGYSGGRLRTPDEVFDVADGESGSWFEPATADAPVEQPAPKAKRNPALRGDEKIVDPARPPKIEDPLA